MIRTNTATYDDRASDWKKVLRNEINHTTRGALVLASTNQIQPRHHRRNDGRLIDEDLPQQTVLQLTYGCTSVHQETFGSSSCACVYPRATFGQHDPAELRRNVVLWAIRGMRHQRSYRHEMNDMANGVPDMTLSLPHRRTDRRKSVVGLIRVQTMTLSSDTIVGR